MKHILTNFNFIFIRTLRNRKNVFYMVMLSLCFILMILVLLLRNIYYYSVERQFNKNVDFRTIMASPNEEEFQKYIDDNTYDLHINELKNLNHVTDVHYSDEEMAILKDIEIDEIKGNTLYLIYGAKTTLPNIIKGDYFELDDSNVMVCPNKVYLNENVDYTNLDKNDIIDGFSLIGKTIKGSYNILEYDKSGLSVHVKEKKTAEFKVIGVYDVDDSYYEMNQCFIPGEQLTQIVKESMPKVDYDSVSSLAIYVDDRKNIDEVMKKVEDFGYYVSIRAYIPDSYTELIDFISRGIMIISIFGTLIISLAYVKKRIINNSYLIGLSRAIGYNNFEIKTMMVFENAIMVILSYLFSVFIIVLLNLIFGTNLINYLKNMSLTYTISPYAFIISFVVILGVSSFANLLYTTIKLKGSSAKLLNGETT